MNINQPKAEFPFQIGEVDFTLKNYYLAPEKATQRKVRKKYVCKSEDLCADSVSGI